MERANMMREKRQSPSVDLLKLIKEIDLFDTTIVCVFEGEDAKYYGSRIDQYFHGYTRKNLSCKGKSNVLTLKNKVENNKEIQEAKIIFFIDKDFDDEIHDTNLYCTPCYSIENLYADSNVLKLILTDELGLCEFRHADIISQIINAYNKFEQVCDIELSELNAWIMSRVKENNENVSLNLNNHDVETFITCTQEEIRKKYSLETLDSIFSIDQKVCQDLLNSCRSTISSSELKHTCRGKYRLEYFRLYLLMLFEMAREKNITSKV
jgi:hypothetical protein